MKQIHKNISLRLLAGQLRQEKSQGVLLGNKDVRISALWNSRKEFSPRPVNRTFSYARKEVSRYVSIYIKELLQKVEQQLNMFVVFYTAEVI